jgi:ATP:ADP antiporter, AAA family
MRGLLSDMPKTDRTAVWVGFWLLFTVVAAHALLETARDTLFLRDLPAANLPWAYIAIAVLCVVAAAAHRRLRAANSKSRTLIATLVAGAAITAGLWFATEGSSRASLFAVYVWTGVLASVVVVQIWLRLGVVLDVVSAKSGFAFAGAGGMAGAALGSWLAELILRGYPPRLLLLAAAAGLCLAALIAAALGGESAAAAGGDEISSVGELVSVARGDPYLMRVLAIAALAPLPLTLTDFLFKAAVTANVAGEDLGSFFARFYAVTNTAALALQLFLIPRLLARLGAVTASAMFPLALTTVAGVAATSGGLALIVAMKAVDASLRHSLNRAGMEILFLPVQPRHRPTAKFLAEAMGQRGGQAVASLLLLVALGAGLGLPAIVAAVALLSGLWLLAFIRLRGHYVARFRSKLSTLRAADRGLTVPDLELDSLETLIGALSSPQDDEVVAALDVLQSYGKAHLIPGLILYHPSADVVLRAMEILPTASRDDTARLVDRLLAHDDPRLRAAALRSRFDHVPARRLESLTRDDPSPLVRSTAILGRLARLEEDDEALRDRFDDLLEDADGELKRAVASAVSSLPLRVAVPLADRLLEDADRGVRAALAESIAERPDRRFLPALTALLATRDARFPARQAMVAIGDAALQHLAELLRRRDLDAAIRRHIPRSISRFANRAAAEILAEELRRDPDTAVRYKILRGLGRLRADDPTLPIDAECLATEALASLRRAIELLSYAVAVGGCLRILPSQNPRVAELLPPLLAEKEAAALERVFRVLQILHPEERFDAVFQGVRADDRQVRAGSIEMLSHVVEDELRGGLVALAGFGDDRERLDRARAYYAPPLAEAALDLAANTGDGGASDAFDEMIGRLRLELADDSDPVLRSVAGLALAAPGHREAEPA